MLVQLLVTGSRSQPSCLHYPIKLILFYFSVSIVPYTIPLLNRIHYFHRNATSLPCLFFYLYIASMSMWLYCQPTVFKASIRMHHDEEADRQWSKRKPDCFFFKQMAAHGENQPSRKENPYHTKMFPDTLEGFYIFIICGLCQPYPDLADVICHKGRSHRYPILGKGSFLPCVAEFLI